MLLYAHGRHQTPQIPVRGFLWDFFFFGPGCIQSTMNLTRSTANMEFTFPLFPSLSVMLFIDIECLMKSVLRVSLKFYLLHLIYSRLEDG